MNKILTLLLILLIANSVFAQLAPDTYWIEFKDKNGTPYTINNPHQYLSERAIERREKYNILIDSTDLPVNPNYISAIQETGLEVINVSKWLNGVVVKTSNQSLIENISHFDFVKSINLQAKKSKKRNHKHSIEALPYLKQENEVVAKQKNDVLSYGFSAPQIYIHNGQKLHNAGYQGQGMLIAITDAGFNDFNYLRAFDSLRINNQIYATRNFVEHSLDVYRYSYHGTNVTSIIGGNIPDTLIGTAPKANYILIATEDVSYENIIEEINWACGAEYADSLGADVINVSLGYFEYDIPYWTHTNSQRDGNTAWISKACNKAYATGMIVVVSAGNSGNQENPYIGMPADAQGALTIGSVNYDSIHSGFSSVGLTSDGRIKPDICAVGSGTFCQQSSGVYPGNGTSFSAPIITGLIACLWQAHPEFSNTEIINAVKQASNQFNSPDSIYGYGIPNFDLANQYLNNLNDHGNLNNNNLKVFPNPFKESLIVQYHNIETKNVELIISSIQGQELYKQVLELNNIKYGQIELNSLTNFPEGYYIISLKDGKKYYNQKLIKIN